MQNAQNKKEDTRSATTNFGKEEVLKVFDRNTRMIPFIMFSLSRINGTLAGMYIYIYIYIHIDVYIHILESSARFARASGPGHWWGPPLGVSGALWGPEL